MQRFELMKRYRQTGDAKFLRDYYNHPEYAAVHARPKRKWLTKATLLADLMAPRSGQRVLDVGCAGKLLKREIQNRGAVYQSLDIAEHFQPDYLCDAASLGDFPHRSFDWIVLADVLEHVSDPEVVMRGALHAGKRLITVVPHLYRLEALGRFMPVVPEDRHLHKQSVTAWERLVRRCGGRVDRSVGFFFIPSFCWDLRRTRLMEWDKRLRASRTLQRWDGFLQAKAIRWSWLKHFAQEVILICRPNQRSQA